MFLFFRLADYENKKRELSRAIYTMCERRLSSARGSINTEQVNGDGHEGWPELDHAQLANSGGQPTAKRSHPTIHAIGQEDFYLVCNQDSCMVAPQMWSRFSASLL